MFINIAVKINQECYKSKYIFTRTTKRGVYKIYIYLTKTISLLLTNKFQ